MSVTERRSWVSVNEQESSRLLLESEISNCKEGRRIAETNTTLQSSSTPKKKKKKLIRKERRNRTIN